MSKRLLPYGLKSVSEKKLPTLTNHKKAIWPFSFNQLLTTFDSSHIRRYGLESVSDTGSVNKAI